MKRISKEFNPKNQRSVRNLHQVLGYLLEKDIYKREYKLRRYGRKTKAAIETLLGEMDVPSSGELDAGVIDRINVALVTKKYQDPGQIAELHRRCVILSKKKIIKGKVAKDEIKKRRCGSSTRAFIQTFQKKYKLSETGKMDPATDEKLESIIASIAGIVCH